MSDFLKPLAWPAHWIRRRNFKFENPPCALASCSSHLSIWQRLRARPRPMGTFLQGVFYCQPQCLESALTGQLSRLRTLTPAPQVPNRIPLGLLMVARGKLTYPEVRAALEAQRRARYGKIGEWIEKLGFATEQEVTTALGLQWGCPVATSFDPATISSTHNIPFAILDAFQMLPLNYVAATNILYIAFGERVDHSALLAIEKLLNCRTQPCVAGRKSVARQLEAMRQLTRTSDVEFGPMNDLGEMARIAASYTTRLTPEAVRLCRVGPFIWLRLDVHSNVRFGLDLRPRSLTTNLVFRLPDASRPNVFAHSMSSQHMP